MSDHIQAARAVTAIFFQRLLLIIGGVAALILALLYAVTTLLAIQVSEWWWLTLIVLVPITLLAIMIIGILYMLSRRLMPRPLTRDERKRIVRFTSSISGLIESAKTPYPLLVFLIAKDVVRGKRSQFLDDHVLTSQTIKSDYASIQRMFHDKNGA